MNERNAHVANDYRLWLPRFVIGFLHSLTVSLERKLSSNFFMGNVNKIVVIWDVWKCRAVVSYNLCGNCGCKVWIMTMDVAINCAFITLRSRVRLGCLGVCSYIELYGNNVFVLFTYFYKCIKYFCSVNWKRQNFKNALKYFVIKNNEILFSSANIAQYRTGNLEIFSRLQPLCRKLLFANIADEMVLISGNNIFCVNTSLQLSQTVRFL